LKNGRAFFVWASLIFFIIIQKQSNLSNFTVSESMQTDEELVKLANEGDEEAFEALYGRYRDWVCRLAWRFTLWQRKFALLLSRFTLSQSQLEQWLSQFTLRQSKFALWLSEFTL